MLPDAVALLIREEQVRQAGRFIEGVDLDAYLAKLGERAEIVTDSVDERYRGFVAFYCNDLAARRAFITLVLVDPRDRGQGVGRALVGRVLDMVKARGFTSCELEVGPANAAARSLYEGLGFRLVERRGPRDLLAVTF